MWKTGIVIMIVAGCTVVNAIKISQLEDKVFANRDSIAEFTEGTPKLSPEKELYDKMVTDKFGVTVYNSWRMPEKEVTEDIGIAVKFCENKGTTVKYLKYFNSTDVEPLIVCENLESS